MQPPTLDKNPAIYCLDAVGPSFADKDRSYDVSVCSQVRIWLPFKNATRL